MIRPEFTLSEVELITAWRLPTIRAAIELHRNNPGKALEVLQPAASYELGSSAYPDYVSAESYLRPQQGKEAAAEYQKLLDHSGVVMNSVTGALARLGLARAYVLQGNTAKARAAYQDFFALWKDADPDILVLKEAKAEYAGLK
jgi:predicted Zn-dependent protease